VLYKSAITTFRPRTPGQGPAEDASPESGLRQFLRFLGRVLVFVSVLCFALSAYLGFAQYWILTHWTKAEASVLSGEIRQGSSGPQGQSSRSSNLFFFHCTVSYPVAGQTLQSQLDSPASTHRIDAQVWGTVLSPDHSVDILYQSSDPHRVRLANNPDEITSIGSIKAALCCLAPGLLLVFASRKRSGPEANCR
jgi:hypothetical protein